MTYIRHREGLVGRHEVVVLHVGGDVDVGPGTARFADQRGPGPGADRHRGAPRIVAMIQLYRMTLTSKPPSG